VTSESKTDGPASLPKPAAVATTPVEAVETSEPPPAGPADVTSEPKTDRAAPGASPEPTDGPGRSAGIQAPGSNAYEQGLEYVRAALRRGAESVNREGPPGTAAWSPPAGPASPGASPPGDGEDDPWLCDESPPRDRAAPGDEPSDQTWR
jgi:hypothetical protein